MGIIHTAKKNIATELLRKKKILKQLELEERCNAKCPISETLEKEVC